MLRQGDMGDWRVRARAQDLIVPAADEAPNDASCLAALGELRFAQGAMVDARRMLRRAESILRQSQDPVATRLLADVMSLRALWLDDWIRNFDYLINIDVRSLGVSTPECVMTGAFCLNFLRPEEFNAKLDAAPSLASVIAGQRAALRQLLDSVLVFAPLHERALRLRMRRAVIEEDWEGLSRVVGMAAVAGSESQFVAFGSLVAAACCVADDALSEEFDIYLARLGEDSLRAFEAELVTLQDSARADGVWRLSDPLYLTPANERRIQFHVRLAMAEIAFADPERRVPGRHSQPGRLVIRYGWPRSIWEVPRQSGVELDPNQVLAVFEYLSQCSGSCPGIEARLPRSGGTQGGRWTFFNYAIGMPSFIFERNLSARTYQYKRMTQTEAMDSAMARNVPSTFEPSYDSLASSVLITRFPRPGLPVVEVHARFRWSESPDHLDSVQVGAFVHERVGGRLVNSGVARRAGWGRAALASALPVVFGPLQVVVEAAVPARNLAVQRRATLRIEEPSGLAVSDILLATDASAAGVPRVRDDVALSARTDSVPGVGEQLALYWEIYGLSADTAGRVSYTVTVSAQEIGGGRSLGAELLRGIGNVLNLSDDGRGEIRWDVERPSDGVYLPEFLVLRLGERSGSVRVRIQVVDRRSGEHTTTERVVTIVGE